MKSSVSLPLVSHLQVASTFLISSWLVLSVALSPPVLSRLLEFARPSWDPFQIATTCCIGLVSRGQENFGPKVMPLAGAAEALAA